MKATTASLFFSGSRHSKVGPRGLGAFPDHHLALGKTYGVLCLTATLPSTLEEG